MNGLRLPMRSAQNPDTACDTDTRALPRPSISPSTARLAPSTEVKKIGHSGKMMSEPKSLRNDAHPNALSCRSSWGVCIGAVYPCGGNLAYLAGGRGDEHRTTVCTVVCRLGNVVRS